MSTEAAVAEIWNRNAPEWVKQVQAGNDRFREVFNNPMFFSFLPDVRESSIVELGCGEGRNTRALAEMGAQMTGVDLSARLIEAGRAAERERPLGIRYWEGSCKHLREFADASFDAAISTMAFMDGLDFNLAAGAVFRVLRAGGWFCFSVTHPCFATSCSRWLNHPDTGRAGRFVSEYWRDQSYTETWGFGAATQGQAVKPELFTILCFPYRLEHYINGLSDSGFRISRVLEPRPTPEMIAAVPALAPLRDVPLYLYFEARKP